MTRAEQAARKAYPINKPKIICKEAQKILQEVYSEGYEQAEKDLALTWEDMKLIIAAEGSIYDEHHGNSHEVFEAYPTEEEFYGEVLRRYGELKAEKK